MKRKFLSFMLLTAMMFAVSSTFVSCKDYDDDINQNATAITALQEQLSTLQKALDQTKADIQTAHSQYVTQVELNNVKAAAEQAAKEAAATVKAEAIAEAIQKCQELVNGKANKKDLDDLATKVASIDEALNKLPKDVASVSYVDAAKKNLQDQIDALNAWKATLSSAGSGDLTGVLASIDQLKKDLEAAKSELNTEIETLKKQMNELSTKVNNAGAGNANVLSVLVNKILTSISLVPDLYIGGIEAIEFKSLAYHPVKPGTSGYIVLSPSKDPIRIDNGMAEATYRLSPNSVDTAKIGDYTYRAAIAETRAVSPTCPVAFNGIKSYDPSQGLLTVNLKKTTTESLKRKDKKIWIVALEVNRLEDKATGQEAGKVYSENHMLDESDYAPQIADLKNFAPTDNQNPWDNGAPRNQYDPKQKSAYGKHFLDSISVYESWVDANQLVYKEIQFDETCDLSQFVTGCYERKYYLGTSTVPCQDAWDVRTQSGHNQITKDELKKYGIALRFAIAGWKNDKYEDKANFNFSAAYVKDVDHSTNQQEFASITKDGVIISKTPENKYQNKAVIGKEPIVRVDMIDTIRGNIIDQRYLKVKWIEKSPEVPQEETVQVEVQSDKGVLNCDSIVGEITWREFIDSVYAKIGNRGVSQAEFEAIYPASQVVCEGLSWTYDNRTWTTPGSDTRRSIGGVGDVGLPIVHATTNVQGDALIATWALYPDDIKRVYFDALTNTKTFRVKVTFNSTRSSYPTIWFYWYMTVSLPTNMPDINGYYQTYWEDPSYNWHYVLPVQYQDLNSSDPQNKAYHLSQFNGTGTDKYCIFDYPLMEPFTWELANGRTKYIVKNLEQGRPYDCYTYDLQFAEKQPGLGTNFVPNYFTAAANRNGDGQYDMGGEPDVNWFACSPVKQAENTTNNKDNSYNGAYDLLNTSISGTANDKLAAEMYWVNSANAETNPADMYIPTDYIAWGTPSTRDYQKRNARLFLDHNNPANQSMLNPLSDENVVTADGMVEPLRTNDKKLNMVVWVALNKYNYLPIKRYSIALVAPLRINADFGGQFEDGQIHESRLKISANMTMSDFRGYVVREQDFTVAEKDSIYGLGLYKPEKKQLDYAAALYKYYEVSGLDIEDVSAIRYTYDPTNSTSLLETTDLLDNGTYTVSQMYASHSVTGAQIKRITNGNVQLSIDKVGNELVFRNNGGTNIEHKIYALIPFTVRYGFGSVQNCAAIPIYPGSK